MGRRSGFVHPYDTGVTSGLRFFVEIIAWSSGPWAVAELSIWFVIPALVVLIGLPAVFSTPGDKKQVIVPTPGPLRVTLELLLHGVAVTGAWIVWPIWLAVAVTICVVAAFVVGTPRTLWLFRGAPCGGDIKSR